MIRQIARTVVGIALFGLGVQMSPEGYSVRPAGSAYAAAEGFGATTPGGAGQPVYRVNSLGDSGPGTLRDALSRGNRSIVFDVAGTIPIASTLWVGAYVTIDGTTAPAPGITLGHSGFNAPVLAIHGTKGAHDVIVRGLRIRGPATRDTNVNSSNDCITISRGAYNVLVDQVSISGCLDGAIDIAGYSTSSESGPPTQNVTVQRSILANTRKMMLIKYGTTRISLHHNLYVDGVVRMPYVTRENLPVDTGTTLDFRNNVVWDWGGGAATIIKSGVRANVVNNLFGNPGRSTNDLRQGLMVCRGNGIETPESLAECEQGIPSVRAYAYVAGTQSVDGVNFDANSTVSSPYPAAPVTTMSACWGAHDVVANAGARPRDPADVEYVRQVVLPTCPDPAPEPDPTPTPTPTPKPDLVTSSVSVASTVTRNVGFGITFIVANRGTAVAKASRSTIVLSRDTKRSSDDVVLRNRDIAALDPGKSSTNAITEAVPTTVSAGSYYLLFIADSTGLVAESSESNNVLAVPITVR